MTASGNIAAAIDSGVVQSRPDGRRNHATGGGARDPLDGAREGQGDIRLHGRHDGDG